MGQTVYTMLLVLKAKLEEDISYSESVIETVGEPCDGYWESLQKDRELLKHVNEHIAFLESE